jgi:ABC-type multidrug transport system ATPase subunit
MDGKMKDSGVIISELSRSYGDVRALDRISMEINRGELFGLIGPDGAGKTTLFRILTTLLVPDSGTAHVYGLDVVKDYKQIRRITGYMAGRFSLYQDLTVEENLRFYATVFGTTVQENYDLIEDIYAHIEPFRNRRAGKLSGGMKQKLALSCALIHKPSILVLDEPTTGVDAVSRKEFWEMLMRLKSANMTILVSTPYMDEARLCDRVALIQKGSLLSVDLPVNVIKGFAKKLYALRGPDIYHMKNDLHQFESMHSVWLFGQELHLTLKDETALQETIAYLHGKGHEECVLNEIQPDIEDCFLELMSLKQKEKQTAGYEQG